MLCSLPLILLQAAVILSAARLTGWAIHKLHQPRVVGEMISGILLGPSVLGWLVPTVSENLFPPESLKVLSALSQAGVILFLFLTGLELNLERICHKSRMVVAISMASILAPFAMGALLAQTLHGQLSNPGVPLLSFTLFMGTAMSITAFPVLARILKEKNLLQTNMGELALSCAAVDDVTAWSILTVLMVLIDAQQHPASVAAHFGLLVLYLAMMVYVVRPLVSHFVARWRSPSRTMSVALVVAGLSSYATNALGIHALFGAFLAGVIMPRNELPQHLVSRLESLSLAFLIPLFFALTGIRTHIGLITGTSLWIVCLLVLLVAIAGKWGGAMLTAHLMGMKWREAAVIGVLLNTRGLVELIILNIGLELRVLSPVLFSMMVIMAVATTLMTAPLLEVLYFRRPKVCPGRQDTLLC